MTSDFFPYGTQYHRAPTPLPEEWETDFAELVRKGYTHVQFRPQWRRHERIRGEYCWDDLDRLCDLARRHGLRVIIKSMLETAPDWVFTELEGTRIGFRGVPIPPIAHAAFYVGGWWPCFDNPAVREAAFEFNRRLAERYASHPAVWFFNAWNEPRSRPAGDCHCCHSVASYRAWLAERFASIEELNAFYGKEWSSFETVFPPESASDYAEMHLWRQWAEHAVASKVRLSYEGLKAGAPDRTVMCHVGCSSVVQDPICDSSNDQLNAAQVDFYGCSYPVALHPSRWIDEADPFYHSAWMRRVDPNFWIQEFYPNNAMWCEPPRPDKLEQILLMALASGCQGFTYWQFRSERFGEESDGWGMREIDGSSTERSEVCDALAAAVARFGRELAGTETRPGEIAVLYHRKNDMLGRLQHMGCDLTGMELVPPDAGHAARKGLKNIFAMYRLLGHNVDFTVPGDDFSRYRLLHLSAVELIEPELAAALTRYVENGGVLVVGYPFACREANTWVTPRRPSCGLEALTGCREGRRRVLPEDEPAVAFYGEHTIHGGGWRVELIPEGGETVATWKEFPGAAAVRNSVGAGRVYTFGANLELGWPGDVNDANLDVLGDILRENGLPVGEEPDLWEMRRGPFRFIFNLGEERALPEPAEGEEEEAVYCAGCQRGQIRRYGTVVYRGAGL